MQTMVKRKSRGCRKPYALIGAIFHNFSPRAVISESYLSIFSFHSGMLPSSSPATKEHTSVYQAECNYSDIPRPPHGQQQCIYLSHPCLWKAESVQDIFYIFHFGYFIDTNELIGGNTKKDAMVGTSSISG